MCPMNIYAKILWGLIISATIFVFTVFVGIYNGWIGYMPPVAELENPVNRFATQIFSEDGKLMGTWSLSRDNRVFVRYDELPSSLVDALVATEDVRFYDHERCRSAYFSVLHQRRSGARC